MTPTSFTNETAEKCVVAAFVTNARSHKLISELTESDFQDLLCNTCFATIRRLCAEGKAIDLVAMSDGLESDYGALKGNELYTELIKLAQAYKVESMLYEQHIKSIKSNTERRRLVEVLSTAYAEAQDATNDTAYVLDRARQSLRDITNTNHTWTDMFSLLSNTTDYLERRYKGEIKDMPTGVQSLDKIISGLRRGEMTIIGARPGVGKSAFAGEIAVNLARAGVKVGIVSREMSDIQYGMRIYASASDIDTNNLKTAQLSEDDWAALGNTLVSYSKLPVSFMFTTQYVEDVRLEAQRQVDNNNMDVLIIDYVQLLQTQSKFEKDYLRIGYISKALKSLALDLNIAVVILAQVGRAADTDIPKLSELRGSGDLEQDADNVIFLYQPQSSQDKYIYPDDKAVFDTWREQGFRYIVVSVAKQRQGEVSNTAVLFNPSRMAYYTIKR